MTCARGKMFQPTGSKKRRKEERKSLGLQMAKDASDLSTTLCSEFRVLYSSYGLFDMGLQIKCNFHWMTCSLLEHRIKRATTKLILLSF